MYGPQVLQSDYELYEALYGATPSQITLSGSSQRASGLTVALIMKALASPMTEGEIFRVQSKDVRGFQLGNPQKRPKKMYLQLFTGEAKYDVSLAQNFVVPVPAITQAELNRIIRTIHTVAFAGTTLVVKPA